MSARFEVTKQSLATQRALSKLAHATSDRVLLLSYVQCFKTYLLQVGSVQAEWTHFQSSRLEQRVLHTFQLHAVKA
jgi:hypothetical protein